MSRRACAWRTWAGLTVAFAVAGCVTDGGTVSALREGGTIAFESIDGPPPDVFHELVQALSAEADTHRLAVVSRDGPASFRVRGYLAAHVQKGKASIAWAFDVYDAGQNRTLRLTGEEAAGAPGRNAWNAANAEVVRRIAQSGMEQLAARFGSAVRDHPTPPVERDPDTAVAVAQADDFRPEAAGIFRLSGSAPPAVEAVAAAPADVPLPRRRPTRAANAPVSDVLALGPEQ